MPQPAVFLAMPPIAFPGLEKSLQEMNAISMAGCVVVLLLLLVCIIRWLMHGALLTRVSRADAVFTVSFRNSTHFLSLFQDGLVFPDSPKGAVYQNACRELCWHLLGTDAVDRNFVAKLRTAGRITPAQWEAVQRTTRHVAGELARPFDAKLGGAGLASLPMLGAIAALLCVIEGLGSGKVLPAMWASALWPMVFSLALYQIGFLCLRSARRRAQKTALALQDFAVEVGVALDRVYVDHRQPMEPLPSIGSMGMADGPNFSLPPGDASPKVVSRTAHGI